MLNAQDLYTKINNRTISPSDAVKEFVGIYMSASEHHRRLLVERLVTVFTYNWGQDYFKAHPSAAYSAFTERAKNAIETALSDDAIPIDGKMESLVQKVCDYALNLLEDQR